MAQLRRGNRIALAAALVTIGVATDQVTHQMPGIGFGLVALFGAAVVLLVAGPQPSARFLLAGAAAFALLMTLRANMFVEVLDLMTALGLATMAAAYAPEGAPVPGSIRAWLANGFRIFGALPAGIASFAPRRVRVATGGTAAVVRALVPAAVAFLIFGGLLASADAVFARVLTTPLRWNVPYAQLPQHLVAIAIATIGAATLVAFAAARRTAYVAEAVGFRTLGPTEWTTVLGTVAALFGLFVGIQFAYLFGGGQQVTAAPGLSYADYARSGFGQMVLAAMLSGALIGLAWLGARGEPGRGVRALSLLLLGLSLVVLTSALKRLALYQAAYGWTETRFLGFAIIAWLAVVLIAGAGLILTRRVGWTASIAVGAALAVVIMMNVFNVDGFIAERNLHRYETTGKIDAVYLAGLSGDATPTLAPALADLPDADRAVLQRSIACRAGEADGPWFAWNAGRAHARTAAIDAGITPARDPGGCDVSF